MWLYLLYLHALQCKLLLSLPAQGCSAIWKLAPNSESKRTRPRHSCWCGITVVVHLNRRNKHLFIPDNAIVSNSPPKWPHYFTEDWLCSVMCCVVLCVVLCVVVCCLNHNFWWYILHSQTELVSPPVTQIWNQISIQALDLLSGFWAL